MSRTVAPSSHAATILGRNRSLAAAIGKKGWQGHMQQNLTRRAVLTFFVGFAACFAVRAEEPIKLGAIYSLTGSYSALEGPALKGARLAIEEINERGGIKGRPLQLIHYDGKSTLVDIANSALQLVHKDKVLAIIGVTDSEYYLASAPIAQDAGIPYLDTGGTVPNLPEQVGQFGHMMPFGDDYQAFVAADFAIQDLGAKSAFLLRDADFAYTRAIAQYFRQRFEEKGGTIVGESSFHTGEPDYSEHISRIGRTEPPPNVIYAAMNPGDDANFVRQAREAGISLPIIGGDAFDNPGLVKNAGATNTKNVYFTTHMAMTKVGKTGEFIKSYAEKYGLPPENAFAGLGYDSVYLIAEAMNKAPELGPSAINDAIFTITEFDGVTGKADFSDRSRAPDKEVTIVAVRDGRFELVANRKP
ncbi:MAG TPA: ABC transporter substrate-binding protein [Rhizobiaceae bacterium]|nr:ABC transporter substrate-binding protein [Rhizobiaceae bacterium]